MPAAERKPALYEASCANPRHFEPGGLLDLPQARHWRREIEHALEHDRYGYQLPVSARGDHGEVEIAGRRFQSLSSYDYLGLIGHPQIEQAATEALRRFGTGTGGVRLLTGTNTLHGQLEAAIARFTGTEAALTLSSGYLANLTPLTALFQSNDLIISDEHAHRSLVESFRLSRAECVFFPHNDIETLEAILRRSQSSARRILIVSEGVFSMDGDRCPLPELVRLKTEYGAFLLVDEAHALGVSGATGRGSAEQFGVPAAAVDLWTGSLSKTIPSNGGYIAGDAALILYLQHAGAPFFFSSALAPMATAAALAAFQVLEQEPERVARLQQNAVDLRGLLRRAGYDTGASDSAIVPVITGSSEAAHELARHLYAQGFQATAVVFPAVPVGGARLRLCARADWTPVLLQEIGRAFTKVYPFQSKPLSV